MQASLCFPCSKKCRHLAQATLMALRSPQVCRHHAAGVASGSGAAECLSCPYHGWTYALDGRLRKAPGMKGAQGFPGV